MKKICVVYFSDNELHRLEIAYGISALENNNFCVYALRVEDINFNKAMHFIKENGDIKYFVIFLSYGCYDLLAEVCRGIKKIDQYKKIIICHSLVNKYYKELINEIPQIDIAVIGEYEETLGELSKLLFSKKEIDSCNGIAFKKNGKIRVNNPRSLLNINDLPFPNRDFDFKGSNFFHVFGSRGCEGYCTFCDRNQLFINNREHYTRWRSIENIVKEIDVLVENYKCKFISFSDPTFVPSEDAEERLHELYDALLKKDYWIQFTFNIRAEQINEAVIKSLIKLKNCGLGKIFIGIESFNKSDLKLFNKPSDITSIRKCIELLSEFNEFGLVSIA